MLAEVVGYFRNPQLLQPQEKLAMALKLAELSFAKHI
jgi:hypothetical protein